jgi:hypothetical protein
VGVDRQRFSNAIGLYEGRRKGTSLIMVSRGGRACSIPTIGSLRWGVFARNQRDSRTTRRADPTRQPARQRPPLYRPFSHETNAPTVSWRLIDNRIQHNELRRNETNVPPPKPSHFVSFRLILLAIARHQQQPARRGHRDWLPDKRELSGGLIHPEHHRVVAHLIRADHPLAAGIQNKIARRFAL